MSQDQSRLARRWAARRIASGLARPVASPVPEGEVLLSAAMALLSDYEDAIYAMCRHALVPAGQAPASESAHLVEAAQLHGDVRRLRLEVLGVIEMSGSAEVGNGHST